jgi:hypothetical protein
MGCLPAPGPPVSWADAEEGVFGVFDFSNPEFPHALFGEVPPPSTGMGPYLLDAQTGTFRAANSVPPTTVAVPFTK